MVKFEVNTKILFIISLAIFNFQSAKASRFCSEIFSEADKLFQSAANENASNNMIKQIQLDRLALIKRLSAADEIANRNFDISPAFLIGVTFVSLHEKYKMLPGEDHASWLLRFGQTPISAKNLIEQRQKKRIWQENNLSFQENDWIRSFGHLFSPHTNVEVVADSENRNLVLAFLNKAVLQNLSEIESSLNSLFARESLNLQAQRVFNLTIFDSQFFQSVLYGKHRDTDLLVRIGIFGNWDNFSQWVLSEKYTSSVAPIVILDGGINSTIGYLPISNRPHDTKN